MPAVLQISRQSSNDCLTAADQVQILTYYALNHRCWGLEINSASSACLTWSDFIWLTIILFWTELLGKMNVDPNPPENVLINSKLVASKLRSKKECFQFLVVDCQIYLPDDHPCVTTYFLKQLCSGEKKCKYTPVIMQSLRHQEERTRFDILSPIWRTRRSWDARESQTASRAHAVSSWRAWDPLAAALVACECDIHKIRSAIQGLGGQSYLGSPRKVCQQAQSSDQHGLRDRGGSQQIDASQQ